MSRAPKFNMPIASPAAAAAVTMPLNAVIEALLTMHNDGTTVRPFNLPVGAMWASEVAGVITVYHYIGDDIDIPVWIIDNGTVTSTALTTRAGMLRIGTEAEHLAGTSLAVAAVPGHVQKMVEARALLLEKLITDKIGAAIPAITAGDVGATLIVGADLKLKTDQMEQRLTTKINAVVPAKLPTDTGKFLQVGPAPGLAFQYAAIVFPTYLKNKVTHVVSGSWVAPAEGFVTIVAWGGDGGGGGGSHSDGDWYSNSGGAGGQGIHLAKSITIPVAQGAVVSFVIGGGGGGGAASPYYGAAGAGGAAGGPTSIDLSGERVLTVSGAPGGGGGGACTGPVPAAGTPGGTPGGTSVFGPPGGAGGAPGRHHPGGLGLLGGGGAAGAGGAGGAGRPGAAGKAGGSGKVIIYY